MKNLSLLTAFLFAASFWGCKDEEEAIPFYVRIEPFQVNAPGGTGGQEITEGWLYAGVDFLGAFTLPAVVPVLPSADQTKLIVFPGVKENGIAATPNIYPFLTRWETTVTPQPGDTVVLQPVSEYDPAAEFPWGPEGKSFAGGSSEGLENQDTDPVTAFGVTTADAFDGHSVLLHVDAQNPVMEVVTDPVELPTSGGQQVWLEMHYRNDVPFVLGLIAYDPDPEYLEGVFVFNVRPGWNKIYFNITEQVAVLRQNQYRLFFRLNLNDAGSATEGSVWLDNIRLVHF
jgi:hypothetical protein